MDVDDCVCLFLRGSCVFPEFVDHRTDLDGCDMDREEREVSVAGTWESPRDFRAKEIRKER